MELVTYELDRPLALVRLNRPATRNAMLSDQQSTPRVAGSKKPV